MTEGRRLLTLAALLGTTACGGTVLSAPPKLVILLARHGVRAPGARMNAGEVETPAAYARSPWPAWPVPPDQLTPRGAELESLLGRYYRERYRETLGAASAAACLPPGALELIADSEERTRNTARAFLTGLTPGCDATVLANQATQALFHPERCRLTGEERRAAVLDRIGSLSLLEAELSAPLAELQNALDCCAPDACGDAAPSPCALARVPSGFTDSGQLYGPLRVGAQAAEAFLLQYDEGMPPPKVAWGRADRAGLVSMLRVHYRYQDVTDSTGAIARAQGSNLVAHVLGTLERAAGTAEGTASGPRLVAYFGHDTNLANVAGLLGLSWRDADGLENPTPPGGALVFELHATPTGDVITASFIAQTMEQMAQATSLGLGSPPSILPVTFATCGGVPSARDCPYSGFRALVEQSVAEGCVEGSRRSRRDQPVASGEWLLAEGDFCDLPTARTQLPAGAAEFPRRPECKEPRLPLRAPR